MHDAVAADARRSARVDWITPMHARLAERRACRAARPPSRPRALASPLRGERAHLGAGAALGADQDEAVDDEEDRGRASASRSARSWCSSAMPRIPVGMLAAMISQASRSVGVSIRRVASVRKNAAMIVDPVAPEVDQQADRAADVEHHDEREPERLGLRLAVDEAVPAEQRREQDGVAEARDREQLGDALQSPSTTAWK